MILFSENTVHNITINVSFFRFSKLLHRKIRGKADVKMLSTKCNTTMQLNNEKFAGFGYSGVSPDLAGIVLRKLSTDRGATYRV